MKLIDLFETVKIDNVRGLGEVPDNQNVDYLGLRVRMRPSVFLKLAATLYREQASSADYIRQHIEQGGGIAAPWLVISVPPEWETGDLEMPARVKNHEGRNRMWAVMEAEGDEPIETHLFFSGGIRGRHITPQWIKRLNNSLIPEGRSLPMGGPFFTTASPTSESTTRTTAKGAPGTLKAKITRHYGGEVTCSKAKRLKSRKDATPHDKAQSNWFLNMQDCDETQLSEVFRAEPEHVRWIWNKHDNLVQTKFEYAGHEVDIGLEPVDGRFFDYAKYVAQHHNITIPDNWTGYNITFSVDDSIGVTMEFGEKGVQLLAKVVKILRGFLKTHKWDYVTFSGEPGSRNRLYRTMSQRLAGEIGGQALQTRNYFVILKKPISAISPTLAEMFKGAAPNARWYSHPIGAAPRYLTSFDFDHHLVRISLTQDLQQRDLHDALQQANFELDPKAKGYSWLFDVDGSIEKTGLLGKRSIGLMGAVVKLVISWLKTNKWDYLTFIGERGSRNKLYHSLSKLIARETGAKTYFDFDTSDFVIYKPSAVLQESGGVGRVVKGVNTTADVQPGETQRQAKRFLNTVSAEGVPPQLNSSGRFAPPK